ITSHRFDQHTFKGCIIRFLAKQPASPVAAIDHMVNQTAGSGSRLSWHGFQWYPPANVPSTKIRVPFDFPPSTKIRVPFDFPPSTKIRVPFDFPASPLISRVN